MLNKINLILLLTIIFFISIFIYRNYIDTTIVTTTTNIGEEVIDTIYIDRVITNFKWKTKTDTIYIDTNNYYHASASFNFNKNNVFINGKVYYDEPIFSFSDIKINYKEQEIISNRIDTIKITTTKYLTKRFTHGLQAGFGYGVINKQLDFYIGYGLQYNFN